MRSAQTASHERENPSMIACAGPAASAVVRAGCARRKSVSPERLAHRRSCSGGAVPPIRQWAEPSFDLHTKDCELAGEQPTLVLPSQDCVLQEIDKDRHASYSLPFPLRSRDSESVAG